MNLVGTPSVQQNPKLFEPEGDLHGKPPGHTRASWEPMGPQKLPIEVRGDSLWVHPVLLPVVQRAPERRQRRRDRSLPIWDNL